MPATRALICGVTVLLSPSLLESDNIYKSSSSSVGKSSTSTGATSKKPAHSRAPTADSTANNIPSIPDSFFFRSDDSSSLPRSTLPYGTGSCARQPSSSAGREFAHGMPSTPTGCCFLENQFLTGRE
ncbi:hypothetical protein L873DRAFT_1803623 [Choiromyces venosus 120613-1]|uniref:Secreted protein n=1 Tax=Choiromyces venosus 120613-1 TaxID=1336337 RepID=A0A3N4JX54_9PEZI|nr:hypothetical protein L873DRAFT_1803623 [Choiromyces venosus 120613-1]